MTDPRSRPATLARPEIETSSRRETIGCTRRRTAGILILCTALIVLPTGCRPPDAEVAYHPPLLPIEVSINSDGVVHLAASGEIATPIGTFSVQQSLAHRSIPRNQTLLVIRRLVRGILMDDLIRIKSSAKMTFLMNGAYDFNSQDNVAVVRPHPGVSGIRIRNEQARRSAPRFSAEQVSTLPTPTVVPSSPLMTEEPSPSDSNACPDLASCPTSIEPSPSG